MRTSEDMSPIVHKMAETAILAPQEQTADNVTCAIIRHLLLEGPLVRGVTMGEEDDHMTFAHMPLFLFFTEKACFHSPLESIKATEGAL
jgi:hypothetical protein